MAQIPQPRFGDDRDDETQIRDEAVRHQSLFTWLGTYPTDRYHRLHFCLGRIIEADPRALPRRYEFNRWTNALIEFGFVDTDGNDVHPEERPSDRIRRLAAQAKATERAEAIRDALAARGYARDGTELDTAGGQFDYSDIEGVDPQSGELDPAIIADLPLMELLVQAEAEWRVDCALKVDVRKSLDIQKERVDPAMDWRNPDAPLGGSLCDWRTHTSDGTWGRMCGRPALPGTRRCVSHGGELLDVDTRRAILMSAYGRIVGAVDIAIDTLIDVAQHSRNGIARVNAARELLDRAGLSAELQVRVRMESDSRSQRVSQLLDQLDEMQSNMESIPTTAKLVSDLTTRPAPEPDPESQARATEVPLVEPGPEPDLGPQPRHHRREPAVSGYGPEPEV